MNKVVHADKSMRMSLRCRRLAVVTCAASVLLVPLVASAEATKFIASGWEFHQADADTLLARADEMDATPIDGCMLPFWAKDKNGGKITSRYILQQPKWDYSDLESVIPSYRKLLSRKAYRSSFLTVFGFHGMKKRVAWTDNETWGRVAHNMRLAARFAKACGFVGLHMDPEDYNLMQQFMRVDSDGMSYEDLAALARKRGREVFSGAFDEFPEAKVLSFWFVTWWDIGASDVPAKYARDILYCRGNSLMPHFIDGIFDVLPPAAALIDGMETAYSWRASRMQYLTTANRIRSKFVGLLSPENRGKYRGQMQTSFGIYPKGYSVVTNGMFYMEPIDGSRLKHLRMNLKQASDAADEFLWFYGPDIGWMKGKNGKSKWSEVIPGLYDTMLAVKDPAEMGRRIRRRMEAGQLVAANANPACVSDDPNKVPKPYWTSNEPARKKFREGSFGSDLSFGHGDKFSLVATGVQKGCFVSDAENIRPGDIVGLSFCSKGRHVAAAVEWKKGDKVDRVLTRAMFPVLGVADADGWKRTDWCAIVPDGADGIRFVINIFQDAGEKTWIDDVYIIPVKD